MTPRITPPPATLDEWDIAFIRLFKTDIPTKEVLNRAIKLWAERCAVDESDFHMANIAEYLGNLIDDLNLTPPLAKVMLEMRPERDWYWGGAQGGRHGYARRMYHGRMVASYRSQVSAGLSGGG